MKIWKNVESRKRNKTLLFVILWFCFAIFAVWVNIKDF